MKNGVAVHLSRLKIEEKISIDDSLLKKQLMNLEIVNNCKGLNTTLKEVDAVDETLSWYADIVNYLACEREPPDLDPYQENITDVNRYY